MPSPLVAFQLAVSDPAGTRAFLDELVDWRPAERDERGAMRIDPGGPGDFDVTGTLLPRQEGREQVTLFFRVEDLWASVARAEELGGSVVMSIRQLNGDGPHVAMVRTPDEELTFGLVQQ